MDKEALLAKLKENLVGELERDNFDLVDLSCFYQGGRLVIRMLVDRSEGGITINECARLNNELSNIIDKENLIEETYLLETSSPGIDRPLKTKKDFLRVLNRNIRLILIEPISEKKEIGGKLLAASEEGVQVETNVGVLSILFKNIKYAVQQV